jgi:hypothetical protein
MSFAEAVSAISAFFSHPFVLMVGSAVLAWRLNKDRQNDK